ncbi:hypothetical protein [Phycicoccus avicenniae]|uniref:hypothetical protein n=1 Tax=Phycicoccus avicenniae TaxID=2828860 RepID=UPI003D2789DE
MTASDAHDDTQARQARHAHWDALEERARAATPGPWEAVSEHGRDYTDEGWSYVAVRAGRIDLAVTYPLPGGYEHDQHEADAAHIAGADPATVLALVEQARKADTLQRQVDAVTALRDEWRAGHEPVHHLGYIADLDRALDGAVPAPPQNQPQPTDEAEGRAFPTGECKDAEPHGKHLAEGTYRCIGRAARQQDGGA